MRCPDCNRFVSFSDDLDRPDDNVFIDDEGKVTGEVTINLCCAQCSTELRTYAFDVEADFSVAFAEHRQAVKDAKGPVPPKPTDEEEGDDEDTDGDEPCELEVEADCEMTSRTDGKGKKRKTLYGHHTTFNVSCSCAANKFDASLETDDEVASTEMEDV